MIEDHASQPTPGHARLVMLPDGYFPNGAPRPWRMAKVLSHSGSFSEIEYLDTGLRMWVASACFVGIAA